MDKKTAFIHCLSVVNFFYVLVMSSTNYLLETLTSLSISATILNGSSLDLFPNLFGEKTAPVVGRLIKLFSSGSYFRVLYLS